MFPASLGRLRARVHRHPDIGLRERGGVVGAVAAHRDQLAARLFLADQRQLVFGGRLGQEIVDPGFRRRSRRR
jgi:fatty acid-binding protein DegV